MTLQDVIADVRADTSLPSQVRTELVNKLEAVPLPIFTDRWIYRAVVLFLGVIALATVVGGLYLVSTSSVVIPGEIVALGSAAIGALAGLLAPSPGQR